MAEILSKQYLGAFSTPLKDLSDIKFPQTDRDIIPLTDFIISRDDLISAMRSIKSSSAPGPDCLPAFLYNHFADPLAEPLLIIWRKSLDSGLMPEGTLLSIVTKYVSVIIDYQLS